MRTCRLCGETKQAEAFYWIDKKRGWRARACKCCVEEARRIRKATKRGRLETPKVFTANAAWVALGLPVAR